MIEETPQQINARVKARQARGRAIRAREAAAKVEAANLSPEVKSAIENLNKQTTENADYEGLILAYRKKHNCTRLEAMRGVERLPNVKKIKEKYLEEKNAVPAPVSVATVDGKDFLAMVAHLKLNRGMSTLEAHSYIDQNFPGLRQHYVDQMNK